jgi:hypothetical protein
VRGWRRALLPAALLGAGVAGEGHDFGHTVALAANGRTAAVGDPDDGGGVGGVWMFTR